MTAKLVPLVTESAQANGDIIALLESLLIKAKQGEFRSLAIAAMGYDHTCLTDWAGLDHIVELIGSASLLHLELSSLYLDIPRLSDQPNPPA